MMGMLWHDKKFSTHPEEVIKSALEYYEDKYGVEPNLIMLNSKYNGQILYPNVAIEFTKSIMPNHVWVGRE